MKYYVLIIAFLCNIAGFSQIDRVEPPHWWTGMENPELQLLVYGNEIGNTTPLIQKEGVSIKSFQKGDSENYLFVDLSISKDAKPGKFNIGFKSRDNKTITYTYELKKRQRPERDFTGFDNTDVVYLITPDRFANGDYSNDVDKSLLETEINREDDYARHGGDIRGIINHLDYIEEMGFTAIWSSPLLINDMKSASYHGYAMTDFYKVDPRFGSLEEYIELAEKAREKGIKLIMDQVANHTGVEHWWMKDLPFDNWINYHEKFVDGEKLVYSNHRRTSNQDAYASNSDKKQMTEGWFVETMPDLNQENPYLATYLIQNSIWWVETLGLGGIRQDTYPYPNKQFMSDWAGAIMSEYPEFNIVGEEWSYNPLLIRYWQDGAGNKDGYDSNLRSTMDFAMQSNIIQGLKESESWDTGLIKMYEGLANDFAYNTPEDIMIFTDNHDMSRVYTQLNEDLEKTKMALGYMLVLPRTPQVYYGTEVLLSDIEKPGDHGLIRTDFPGGWKNSGVNAFTGENLSSDQSEMKNFLKNILNYRKTSNAIHEGKTIHFAPEDKVYLISRQADNESVVLILNKNEETIDLDLNRFDELDLKGREMKNILTGEKFVWKDSMSLSAEGAYLFTTKIN